MADGGAENTH